MMPLRGGFEDDEDNDFPMWECPGRGRLRGSCVGTSDQHFLGGADDQRDHHEAQRQPARVSRMPLHRHDHQRVNHDAPDDGRRAVENIGREPDAPIEAVSQTRKDKCRPGRRRDADQGGQADENQAADDGVGHAAARFAGRFWQLREKVPIERTGPQTHQVEKNQRQRQDDHERAGETKRRDDQTFAFASDDEVCSWRSGAFGSADRAEQEMGQNIGDNRDQQQHQAQFKKRAGKQSLVASANSLAMALARV